MLPRMSEPKCCQGAFHLGPAVLVHSELGEGESPQGRQRRRDEPIRSSCGKSAQRGLVQGQQRPVGIDSGPFRVGLPEHVVEDLQRQRPGIAGGQHVAEERRQVERALPGKQPVVPAPLQDVHVQVRGIGQLQEEQLLAGDLLGPGGVGSAGQDVETVHAEAKGGVTGGPHDVPGSLIGVHEAAPRQCLVGDPHPPALGQGGELVQLVGDPVVVIDGVRRDGRAHQDEIGAQLLHHVELAFRPAQVRPQRRRPDGVEVPERLVQVDGQAKVGAPIPDGGRGQRRHDQVRLEDLDTVEPGRRRGDQLVLQGARDAHRGQRGPQAWRRLTGAARISTASTERNCRTCRTARTRT